MATIDLGRLGFVNKGTYNNSTTYEKNDLVQFTDGGILSTYLYIDSTAQSGQAPSSSGTAGSRWVYFAKGVADAIASAGNNKILVTDGSGNLSPLAIGSASQVLKVNSGANGFEFATDSGGGLLQMKQILYDTHHGVNHSTMTAINSNFKVDITPTAADSKFLLEGFISAGQAHHDVGCTFAFLDSQVGTGDSNAIPPISTESNGSRIAGSFAGVESSASDSATDDYRVTGTSFSTLYTPSSQNTNQRTFQIATKRNGYSYNILINYSQNNHSAGIGAVSMLRVSEIANSIT